MMLQILLVILMFIAFLTLLVKAFKEHVIKIKDLFAFTIIFWSFYVVLRNEQLLSQVANYFGFQVASNLIFAGISVVLSGYMIKLHFKVVKLERKLRSLVFTNELEKIKKIL